MITNNDAEQKQKKERNDAANPSICVNSSQNKHTRTNESRTALQTRKGPWIHTV